MEIETGRVEIFNFLRPKPSPFPLLRIGGQSDGAYLVPDDLAGISDCFSPGVANRKDFEDELLARCGIRSHLMDYSSTPSLLLTPLEPGKQFFREKWLGGATSGDVMSLDDWVASDAGPVGGDLIMQMDIEGAEYSVLESASPQVLSRFRIILVELHGLAEKMISPDEMQLLTLPLVRKLDESFVSVHVHANNCCGMRRVAGVGPKIPNVLELTLLRKDRLTSPSLPAKARPVLPHPLDIRKNAVSKPYVELDQGWSSKPSSMRAVVRRFVNLVRDLVDPRVKPRVLTLVLDRTYLTLPSRARRQLRDAFSRGRGRR